MIFGSLAVGRRAFLFGLRLPTPPVLFSKDVILNELNVGVC